MDIRFLGHACFELADGDASVLIDPFLKPNNPVATVTGDELDPTTILVTHGHADHLADAVPIARRSGATVAAIVELANWFDAQGVESTVDPNLGGTVEFDWGWAKLVQAFHTSTTPGSEEAPFSPIEGTVIGMPGGWVVNIGGKTLYHTGDTALFGDM
jgi:L-ascorbate metabolism protein UlaG (beta-lactamase superfamily)